MKISLLFETKPYSEMTPDERSKAQKARKKAYHNSKMAGKESYKAREKRRGKGAIAADTKKAREKDPEMQKAQEEDRKNKDKGKIKPPGPGYERDHPPGNRKNGQWVKSSEHDKLTNKRKSSKGKS